MALFPTRLVNSIVRPLAALAVLATGAAVNGSLANAAEPVACLSNNPTDWPAPSKPYFMIIVDNSGSMSQNGLGANSCGYEQTRNGHARCAVKNTVAAYSGEVNFGLMTYAAREIACGAAACGNCGSGSGNGNCFSGCTHQQPPGATNSCGILGTDPGIGGGNGNVHRGGYVVVPMLQDHYWSTPPSASNVPGIQALVNNNCTNGVTAPDGVVVDEIGANVNTPLGGSLFSAYQYFNDNYNDPFSATTLAVHTPIGTAAQGERGCRPVNIILLTDGDETCDCPVHGTTSCQHTSPQPPPIAGGCASLTAGAYPNGSGEAIASYEADKLFHTGVTVTGNTYAIKTYVIGFAGANTTALNHIAACGGSGSSFSTANESQISQALSTIIAGSITPETCDNKDNNCNGCTDEGSTHFCDINKTTGTECCSWCNDAAGTGCNANPPVVTAAQENARQACITSWKSSITAALPNGNQALLPCTTVTQAKNPKTWLCFDAGEKCDNLDNNCDLSNGTGTIDEGVTKCAYKKGAMAGQLHCPTAEVCNGEDDNCDGNTDEGAVCGTCTNSPETCDGCDNDCNGIIDDNLGAGATIPCGFPAGTPGEPAWCTGTQSCLKAGTAAPSKGACVAGGGYGNCTVVPRTETCNGLDDDCNGVIDDNIPSVACIPSGAPAGLVYDDTNPKSQCHKGTTVCTNGVTQCVGWVGPSTEICDGLDNNCNGQVDEGSVPGTGGQCGISRPPCTPGVTACVNGALVCQGGKLPQPEICDGIDNDCDGSIDEGPLTDAPPTGMTGCWTDTGNCCTYPTAPAPGQTQLHWCPPAGATCSDLGSLKNPCHAGLLACQAGAWQCVGPAEPKPEVCDGVDNDCNGTKDDGALPGVGTACGSDVGECKTGTTVCDTGVISCVGAIGPTQETCDGKDNDCDGTIDNGIPVGGPCTPDYDTALYPGDRSHAPCQPGHFACDGTGAVKCVGGVGPSPEICDGIDNDCDGKVDEVGAAPDGIDGTHNPQPSPDANIGDDCGATIGECAAGKYACVTGQFACVGGKSTQPEVCDCKDNDCDGTVDNPPAGGSLCSDGKDCVKGSSGCQCAKRGCGEVGCPLGQKCEQVTDSSSGMAKGEYCVIDESVLCGDCTTKKVFDGAGKVVCAPAGTVLDGCITPPVCVCKGQNGCQEPCLNVTCDNGTVCATSGPNAGTCVQPSCFNIPCQGCGVACNLGSCQTTKCDPNPCPTDQACVPVLDPTDPNGYTCVKSCADVTCPSKQRCEQGVCKPTCSPDCAAGEFCDETQTPPVCATNKCEADGCSDGSCCNPATGACGVNCPCNGVICPDGQECQNDSCVESMGTGGSTSATGTGTGTGTSSATGSGTGGGNTSTTHATGTGAGGTDGAGGADIGVFGQANGGGGCQCEMGDDNARPQGIAFVVAALAAAMARRRRRSPGRRAGEGVQS